jgi:tetratricopeptide (TPR) repeat protein
MQAASRPTSPSEKKAPQQQQGSSAPAPVPSSPAKKRRVDGSAARAESGSMSHGAWVQSGSHSPSLSALNGRTRAPSFARLRAVDKGPLRPLPSRMRSSAHAQPLPLPLISPPSRADPLSPAADAYVGQALPHLRRLAAACAARHQYTAAAYYAEKATTLGGGDEEDVFALATAHYSSGEYARALRVLDHHGLLDVERQAFLHPPAPAPATSSSSTSGGRAGENTRPRAAAAAAGGGKGVEGPSPSSSSSSSSHPPPSQLHGAVRPESLRFFHLAALCYTAQKAWDTCIVLLEGCMEGRGHGGLRVPLRPVEEGLVQDLAALAAAGYAGAAGGTAAARPAPLAPSSSARANAGGSGAVAGLEGHVPPEAEPFYGSGGGGGSAGAGAGAAAGKAAQGGGGGSLMGSPASSGRGNGGGANGAAAAAPTAASADGLRVWATLVHMALQHSQAAAALTAGGGGAGSITPVLPPSLLGLNAPAGHVPVSDGSSINLVAALCELRAQALLASDNRLRAAQWFLAALRLDPYSVGALQAVLENHLLTDDEEGRLLAYLRSALGTPQPLLLVRPPRAPAPATSADGRQPSGSASARSRNTKQPAAGASSSRTPLHQPRSASVSTQGSRDSARGSTRAASATASGATTPRRVASAASMTGGKGGPPGSATRGAMASTASFRGRTATPAASGQPSSGPPSSASAGLARSQSMRTPAAAKGKAGAAGAAGPVASPPPASGQRFGLRNGSRGRLGGGESDGDGSAGAPATDGAADVDLDGVGEFVATTDMDEDEDGGNGASSSDDDDDVGDGTATAPARPESAPASTTTTSPPVPFPTVDCAWLLALYGMRLNRYSLVQSRGLGEKFGALETRFRLGASLDVLAAKGEALLAHHDPGAAAALTRRVVAVDPFNRTAAAVHYASLVSLRKSAELFQVAHAAVSSSPRDPLSWYGVACYYLTLPRYAAAVRHLGKAVQLDPGFAPAWVALAQAYAGLEEVDPALAACRTALRLYPASHVPPLTMASLCLRTGSTVLAKQYIDMATARCPHDPGVYHEAGVLEYRQGNISEAHALFRFAASILADTPPYLRRTFEATYVNLGHAARKLGHYAEAIEAYNDALGLAPGKASTLAALAFAHQLNCEPEAAAAGYHAALSRVPDDSFCQRMLRVALQDMLEGGTPRQLDAMAAQLGGMAALLPRMDGLTAAAGVAAANASAAAAAAGGHHAAGVSAAAAAAAAAAAGTPHATFDGFPSAALFSRIPGSAATAANASAAAAAASLSATTPHHGHGGGMLLQPAWGADLSGVTGTGSSGLGGAGFAAALAAATGMGGLGLLDGSPLGSSSVLSAGISPDAGLGGGGRGGGGTGPSPSRVARRAARRREMEEAFDGGNDDDEDEEEVEEEVEEEEEEVEEEQVVEDDGDGDADREEGEVLVDEGSDMEADGTDDGGAGASGAAAAAAAAGLSDDDLSDDGDRSGDDSNAGTGGFVLASSLLHTPASRVSGAGAGGAAAAAGAAPGSGGSAGSGRDYDLELAALLQQQELEEAHATAVALAASGVEVHLSEHGALLLASPDEGGFEEEEGGGDGDGDGADAGGGAVGRNVLAGYLDDEDEDDEGDGAGAGRR